MVSLPSGTGRDMRVAVIAKDAKAAEATEAAGADIVGAEDLVERIQGGFMEFDRVIATPDMMALVGRLGKVLGPRGLMPNPRVGTVTPNVGQAVKDAKGGAIEFRVEKAGIVHAGVGKASLHRRSAHRQRQGADGCSAEGQALRREGDLHPADLALLDHGPWLQDRADQHHGVLKDGLGHQQRRILRAPDLGELLQRDKPHPQVEGARSLVGLVRQ